MSSLDREKKIGVITFHCVYNYGAVLQTYALQRVLDSMGYTPEVIDFRPSSLMNEYMNLVNNKSKKAKIYNIIYHKRLKNSNTLAVTRYSRFDAFIKNYFDLSENVYLTTNQIEADPPIYDAYICGSDQIWNVDLNNNEDAYFLSFVKDNHKKIAYAPSLGIDEINADLCAKENLIKAIPYISLREKYSIDIVRKNFNIEAENVVDPVFLLEPKQWKSYFKNAGNVNEYSNYIFVYIIGEHRKLLDNVIAFAEKHNLMVIIVSIGTILFPKLPDFCINKSDADPFEFLSLLYHADYIVTNSFHGMAFSIIFNKRFLVTKSSASLNTRIFNVLNMFDLDNVIYTLDTEITKQCFIDNDYVRINERLEEERKNSINFLSSSIESIF